MRKQLAASLALTVVALFNAGAQIGYEPARSPYRDLEKAHEFTYFTGYYRAHHDPAGVAPRDGALMGFLYQWLVSGPANLTAEVARVASERRVLDPDLPATCASGPAADCKLIARYRWPLYFADFGIALNLTGSRTYHRVVPEVRAGLGFVSDFHTQSDVGDFALGTKLAMSYGAAIRWVPHGRYQMRFGYADRIFTVRYPESYYTLAPDSSRIRPLRTKPKVWMNNRTFTLGLSYLFGR